MQCLICRRSGVKTFNINFLCGDAQYTVKDDLTEFLGSVIEPHLMLEDVVCNVCMNVLDEIAKAKRQLVECLCSPKDNSKSIYPKLGKFWDFFAQCAKLGRNHFEGGDYSEPVTPTSLTSFSATPTPNRSTPSQFWSVSHSKEYNPELEKKSARREMVKTQRSQSKASVRSTSSYGNDEEVAKLFKGKKRKGGRPKSVGGLPKIITKNLKRVQSENNRSISSLSDLSCVSYSRPKKDFRPKTPKLIYGVDKELLRPKTRSISRMLFYCSECSEDTKDMNMFTAHMVSLHNYKACFRCLDCGNDFMTREHLSMHEVVHGEPLICTICGEKQSDIMELQRHNDRHLKYSVPCSYCDLSFLSEYECNIHTFNHHRGRKRKFRDRRQYKIEEIVTYVDVESNETASKKSCTFVPMILDIKKRRKVHQPSFDEIDYRARHPQTCVIPEEETSLGDDCLQDDRLSSSSDSDSQSSDPDADHPANLRRRVRRRLLEQSPARDLSPLDLGSSYEDCLTSNLSVVLDRLSPLQDRVSNLEDESITTGDESNNSDHSDDIETELHYLVDGKTLHTNVDLADIVNIGSLGSSESNAPADLENISSLGSSESNAPADLVSISSSGSRESIPPTENVELDPDIGSN